MTTPKSNRTLIPTTIEQSSWFPIACSAFYLVSCATLGLFSVVFFAALIVPFSHPDAIPGSTEAFAMEVFANVVFFVLTLVSARLSVMFWHDYRSFRAGLRGSDQSVFRS